MDGRLMPRTVPLGKMFFATIGADVLRMACNFVLRGDFESRIAARDGDGSVDVGAKDACAHA